MIEPAAQVGLYRTGFQKKPLGATAKATKIFFQPPKPSKVRRLGYAQGLSRYNR